MIENESAAVARIEISPWWFQEMQMKIGPSSIWHTMQRFYVELIIAIAQGSGPISVFFLITFPQIATADPKNDTFHWSFAYVTGSSELGPCYVGTKTWHGSERVKLRRRLRYQWRSQYFVWAWGRERKFEAYRHTVPTPLYAAESVLKVAHKKNARCVKRVRRSH